VWSVRHDAASAPAARSPDARNDAALRDADIRGMWGDRVIEFCDAYLAALRSGLNQLPVHRGTVRRGIWVPAGQLPEVLARYRPGRTVVEPAVLSTNAAGASFDRNVEFEMISRTGCDVSAVQAHGEMLDGTPVVEVAFPPGSRFVVTNQCHDPDGVWRIGLRDVSAP
jgi:hypothetical protein